MKATIRAALTILPFLQLIVAGEKAHAQQSNTLQLVAARDHVTGSFLGSEAGYADRDNIFLASAEGNLIILKNQGPKFLPVTTIAVSPSIPLNTVRGDGTNIYVTSDDGSLHIYSERAPFTAANPVPYGAPLNSLAVDLGPKGFISMSEVQGSMAADALHLYLSELNMGDVAISADKVTHMVEQTFGQTPQQNLTMVFDRSSGNQIGTLPNPLNNQGSPSKVALFADGEFLVQTTPGCCGTGIVLNDATTLQQLAIINEPFTNTVATMNNGQWLVAGTEVGKVVLYDITNVASHRAPVKLASIDLRQVTGHTGSEDIEIRSLFVGSNGLIFAASSWGNSSSKAPTLPSFFVLKVK